MYRFIPLMLVVLAMAFGGSIFVGSVDAEDAGPVVSSFVFSRFEFIGDVLLPVDPLHEAFQPFAGTALSMDDLNDLTDVVEAYYAQHGYPFVLAYFPEQTVEDGVVFMAVIVGRYGRIGLDNRSRLRSSVANKLLRSIYAGHSIYTPFLNAQLSRLQSLPGVTADVMYAAGDQFGETDVTFEIDDATRWRGGVTVATTGPSLFRQHKLAADAAWLNPFGWGDRVELTLSTDGTGTAQVEAAYEIPVGAALDYNLRANASWSGYRLTGSWAGLGHGWSGGVGLGLARTWTMATGAQVQGDLSVDHRRARDEFIGSVTSHQVTSLKGTATWTPENGQPVVSHEPEQWSVHVVVGHLALGTPGQRTLDAATAKTEGVYALARFDAHWRFPSGRGATTVWLSGQWAAKNLASSEKFSLAQQVRSNPAGRVTGDDGWSFQMAYNSGPGSVPPLPGGWLATVFADIGGVMYNKMPWDATGRGGRTAAGVGLRLDWQLVDGLAVRLQQGWTVFDSSGVVPSGEAGPLSLSITYAF